MQSRSSGEGQWDCVPAVQWGGTAVSVGSFLQMGETRILGVDGGESSSPPTQRR